MNITDNHSWQETAINSMVERYIKETKARSSKYTSTRIERFLRSISPKLKSKTKNNNETITALIGAAERPDKSGIIVVLASPTAEREITDFVSVSNTIRENLAVTDLDIVLVRWENLRNQNVQTDIDRQNEFRRVTDSVQSFLKRSAWEDCRVHKIDIYSPIQGIISSPPGFASMAERISRIEKDRNLVDQSDITLADDIRWTKEFYAKQESLGKLGNQQPLHDLTIRAELGRAMSSGKLWCGQKLKPFSICLTSELTTRMTQTYRMNMANFNILVRSQLKSVSNYYSSFSNGRQRVEL